MAVIIWSGFDVVFIEIDVILAKNGVGNACLSVPCVRKAGRSNTHGGNERN